MSREKFLEICEVLTDIMQTGTYEEARRFFLVNYQEFPEGVERETMKVFFEAALESFTNEDDLQMSRDRLLTAIEVMKNSLYE